MRFIGRICLCKPCPNVCLHRRQHEGIDVTNLADPFTLLLCATCWAYRFDWSASE